MLVNHCNQPKIGRDNRNIFQKNASTIAQFHSVKTGKINNKIFE